MNGSSSRSAPVDEPEPEYRTDRIAVVIGINRYDDPQIPNLPFAAEDADEFYKVLVDRKRGRFNPANVAKLIGPEATKLKIERIIGSWLPDQVANNPEATAIIFFCGHGECEADPRNRAPDGYAKYLLPVNADPQDLRFTALASAYFTQLLTEVNAKKLVIFLDACFAGAVAEGATARGDVPASVDISDDIQERLKAFDPTKSEPAQASTVIIAAARSSQRSYEHDSLRHGIFTYHLIEALSGKADFNRDGYIGLRDVYQYLEKTVPKTARDLCKQVQKPVMNLPLDDAPDLLLSEDVSRLREIKWEKRKEALKLLFKTDKIIEAEFFAASKTLDERSPPDSYKHLIRLLDQEGSLEMYRAFRDQDNAVSKAAVVQEPVPALVQQPLPTDSKPSHDEDISAFDNSSWNWLQKPWWFFCDVIRCLKPARFSFFVAWAGAAVFLLVQQGTEILRALAEPHADTGKLDFHPVVFFYGALLIWSLQSWYWARVLLAHRPLPTARTNFASSDEVIAWFRLHGPRILGVLPPLLVAWGCFFIAPAGYSAGAAARTTLYKFGAAAVLMAVLLYLFFILRRLWLKVPVKTPTESPAGFWQYCGTLWAVLAFTAFALVLLALFWTQPVKTGLYLGSGAILCLAAATWVSFGSVVVLAAGRLRLPLIGLLLVWAILCSGFNDNHAIRTVPTDAAPQTTASSSKTPVKDAFILWHDAVQKAYPMTGPAPRPVFIVTTEGGGIRAAYWTAVVLSALQDRSLDQRKAWIDAHPGQPPPPDFASHVFAISGVSGGSLGAVVFNALLAENVAYPMENKAHDILRQDFLSPTLAAMFFPDLLQRFLPVPFASADRGAALEKAWEYGWSQTISGTANGGDARANRLAQPFRKLWQTWKGEVPLPALFLNGTRVESGKRIITSNLPITSTYLGEFTDAEDAEEKLGNNGSSRDIPLSTAASMSARFTYVSPAGLLPDGGHVVDGGYFENSGAATALEILYKVEAAIEQGHWPEPVVPIVIEIRNGPTEEKPDTRKETTDARKDALHTRKDSGDAEKKTKREFLGGVLAPINTLIHKRAAGGTFSQEAIESEQQSRQNLHPELNLRNQVLFGLHDSPVPLPLGWMLSGDAAKEMRRQLHENHDNAENADAVMGELLETRPAP